MKRMLFRSLLPIRVMKVFSFENRIGDKGAKEIADALKVNTSLTSLILHGNKIGDEGAKGIADALRDNTSLTSLVLDSNKIGDEGAKEIADALTVNTSLISLSLWYNSIGPEGAKDIADALKDNTSLTSLDFENNFIGPKGAKEIADALKVNTSWTSLKLGWNSIGSEGAKEIADALKENTSLTSLSLGGNDIGDEGAKDIADALKVNRTLTELNLGGYDIGDEGAKDIANALKVNRTLTELNLLGNKIGPSGAKSITVALEYNNTLVVLRVSRDEIGDDGLSALKELNKKRPLLEIQIGQFTNDTQEAKKELARRVAGKKTRWGQCKLMVVGEGRAGKTQTIRSLVGDTFEEVSVSTLAGEIDQFQTHMNGSFSRLVKNENQDVWRVFFDIARSEVITEPKRTKKTAWNMIPRRKQVVKQQETPRDVATVQAEKLISKPIIKTGERESRLVFTIWDFGGQDVFKVIHHLFLSDDGVYVLVFDMAKLLLEETQEENKRTLLFWLRSIEMHSQLAPVIIVGTHLDECENVRETAILTVNGLLKQLIPENMKASICMNERLSFFPVDNQRLDGSDLSVFEALRDTIVSKANSLKSVTREDIPMRWLLFLDSIRERKNVTPTIDLDYLLDDLKEFSIEADEANQMLQFFHKMGTFLHWNTAESLKCTVVLKPHWLIVACARIVHSKEFHQVYLEEGLLEQAENQDLYDQMHTTGIIQRELLENVLWADEQFNYRIAYLLELFEQMLLLCKYGDAFVVPALLRNLDDDARYQWLIFM